jgi:hypothetical protein
MCPEFKRQLIALYLKAKISSINPVGCQDRKSREYIFIFNYRYLEERIIPGAGSVAERAFFLIYGNIAYMRVDKNNAFGIMSSSFLSWRTDGGCSFPAQNGLHPQDSG